ncbi:unnamed protein product, partial [Prorocentrum cordatum]
LSIAETAAVGKPIRRQYRDLLDQFLSSSKLGALGVAATMLDAAAVSFFDELCLAGEVASTGEKLIAAIAKRAPSYQSKGRLALPRARRALRGWRVMRPSRARRPLPWATCMGVARRLWQISGEAEMAIYWLLMANAYLRPGEAHRLTKGQALPPHAKMPKVTVHTDPDYLRRPGRTGEMGETVDLARPWLASLVAKPRQGDPTDPLWTFTMTDVKRAFDSAATSLDLGVLQPVLCMAQRSGASIDRQPASVRRLEKRGLIQAVWKWMSTQARECSLRAEAELPALLAAA